MREDLGERTLEPTAKRLQDARDSGDVPRSAEAAAAIVLAGVTLLVILAARPLWEAGQRMMTELLTASAASPAPVEASGLHSMLASAGAWAAVLGLPLIGVPFVLAILGGASQVGIRFSPAAAAPDPGRANPIRGFQRVFGIDSWMRFALDVVKVLLVIAIAGWSALHLARAIGALPALEAGSAISRLGSIITAVAIRTVAVLFALGAVDWLWQRVRWRRRLRMTREEMKDELRQTEGDPEAKLRRRQMARQIAMHRVRQAVPRADVIVTNPEHISVALAYRQGRDRAPLILAMGADSLAMLIRQIAEQHGIPIVERKPLARSLWRHGDVGREVPQALWKAVAEVLAFVYRLKGRAA